MDNLENSNEEINKTLENLKLDINKIKERNKRKKQKSRARQSLETSMTHKVSIIILTYIVMVLVMNTLKMEELLINAIILTLGFTLSTFSMSLIKIFWLKKR